MFKRIRDWFYARRARRCDELGHQRIIVERPDRKDGLYVIEQRIQCQRCEQPLSDWYVVLSETSPVEEFWSRSA